MHLLLLIPTTKSNGKMSCSVAGRGDERPMPKMKLPPISASGSRAVEVGFHRPDRTAGEGQHFNNLTGNQTFRSRRHCRRQAMVPSQMDTDISGISRCGESQ